MNVQKLEDDLIALERETWFEFSPAHNIWKYRTVNLCHSLALSLFVFTPLMTQNLLVFGLSMASALALLTLAMYLHRSMVMKSTEIIPKQPTTMFAHAWWHEFFATRLAQAFESKYPTITKGQCVDLLDSLRSKKSNQFPRWLVLLMFGLPVSALFIWLKAATFEPIRSMILCLPILSFGLYLEQGNTDTATDTMIRAVQRIKNSKID